ncbi:MAG: SH3 domain-containing protein [Lewinellaceae bacterium]|nr:SH3 domain-containing protein [Lewinellaceae bacterium]
MIHLFKKSPIIFLGCLFCFSTVIDGQSCLCDAHENEHTYQWYKVTAPSGLVLRTGPNRNTARLDAIPYGEEVLLCSHTGSVERIEGITGKWLKVSWTDKTGYLFSGFLQEISMEERKVRMVLPNSGVDSGWECMNLDSSLKWSALVELDKSPAKQGDLNPAHFSTVNLEIGKKSVAPYCSPDGWLNSAVLNLVQAPFAVFAGCPLAQKVVNQVKTPIKLMPGEVTSFATYDPGKKSQTMYVPAVHGNIIPNANFVDDNTYNRPIDSIGQYQILLFQRDNPIENSGQNAHWVKQKLIDQTIRRPGDTDTYAMDVFYVYFAGDIDGDHQLDLILATLNGTGRSYRLYLSSKKLPGFLLRYVAKWFDSSC